MLVSLSLRRKVAESGVLRSGTSKVVVGSMELSQGVSVLGTTTVSGRKKVSSISRYMS